MKIVDMVNIISQDKYISKWIHGLDEGSKKQYLFSMADFCIALNKTPSKMLKICKSDYSKPP